MSTVTSLLIALFEQQGWAVESPPPEGLAGADFDLVAENDVAVVFVSATKAADIQRDSAQLSASIAAALQRLGSPKVWEAYLVLLVPGLRTDHDESILQVQRDLTYCRKLVVSLDTVLGSRDPSAVLLQRLALLFPLSLVGPAEAADPATLLERGLIDRGNEPEIVRGLLAAVTDPAFDPLVYFVDRLPK